MEECAFQKSSATAHDSAKPKQGTLWITTKSPTDVRSTWWFRGGGGVGGGVVISRFLGRITTVITSVRGHITPLITTHELLNLVSLGRRLGVARFLHGKGPKPKLNVPKCRRASETLNPKNTQQFYLSAI